MKHAHLRRLAVALGILILLAGIAFTQRQALARAAIVAAARAFAHVNAHFGASSIGMHGASFSNIVVTSARGEPIAHVERASIGYDLRALLDGTRLYGLTSLDVVRPHIVIIRHADGTYNVPIPKFPSGPKRKQAPLRVAASLTGGSVDVIDEGRVDPHQRHLYVRDLQARGTIDQTALSRYAVSLRYGQRAGELYPIHGNGNMDARSGYGLQRWTAPYLPIAGAVDFALDSPSLHVAAGHLQDLDARIYAMPHDGEMESHVAATAQLAGARIAVGGLTKPVDNVHGRLDVDEAGLSIARLDATLAGVPVVVSGGAFLHDGVQARMAIRGNAGLAQLRGAFAQASRLPMNGPISFGVLAEGFISKPLEWISVRSPHVTYAGKTVADTDGLVAFDGQEADISHFTSSYNGIGFGARGRVAMQRRANAIEMLAAADLPSSAIPYGARVAPGLSLHALALATADNPKQIAVRGVLTGSGARESLDGTFDVASNGTGSIGPIVVSQGDGRDLYFRAAIDRPHDRDVALIDAHRFVAGNLGALDAHGIFALHGRSLRGNLNGTVARGGAQGQLVASLGGTLHAPRLAATTYVADERYANYDVNGAASVAFANGTLELRDALMQVGPAFVSADGTIAGVTGGAQPRYDLNARLETADAAALLAAAHARLPEPVEGSVDADVHVSGTPSQPSIAGTFDAPEGSVNGLAFRNLSATIDGTTSAMTLGNGRVVIGDTPIGFSGSTSPAAMHVALSAPRTDLADFNDFFDTGDMFAGTGSLALDATTAGKTIVASAGSAHFTDARFRRIALGTVNARWHDGNHALVADASFGGPTGVVAVHGSLQAPFDKLRVTRGTTLVATARHVDLATWLPMLGMNAPITGKLDADANVAGSYPNVATRLRAGILGGTAGRMAIQRATIVASTDDGRGRIDTAVLQLPDLTTTVAGTFGLHRSDPFDVTAHTVSPDIGALAKHATGKIYDVGGRLDSTTAVTGTLGDPHVVDDVAVTALRAGKLNVARAKARVIATRQRISVSGGEADFQKGRVLLAAAVPLTVSPHGIAPARGPFSATVTAQNLEGVDISGFFPKGTHVGGRIDGTVRAGGTIESPSLHGSLALAKGAFIGPIEKAPVKNVNGRLLFEGHSIALQGLHGDVGGGSVALDGTVSAQSWRSLKGLAFTMHERSESAHIEMPLYMTANIDSNVSVARTGSGPIAIGGNFAVSSARIPPTLFFNPRSAKKPPPKLPPIAFKDFKVTAGRDVRIQSSNVDVGGTGTLTIGGTLAQPALAGAFDATGGTIDFYHTFTVQRASVTVAPGGNGINPYVNAVATTYIPDPATAIRMHVTGPVSDMNLALASDPDYDREQILGLLLGVNRIGAVRGVSSGQTASGGFSMGGAAQSLARAQVNTVFTRQLLEPLSASLGSSLGFSDLMITNDLQTGLGLNAAKAFGKNLTATFNENFGQPKTQAVALEAHPSIATGIRMRMYSTSGPSLVGIAAAQQQPSVVGLDALNLNPATAIAAVSGTSGFDLDWVHKFPPK
jgi:hypothetical protein